MLKRSADVFTNSTTIPRAIGLYLLTIALGFLITYLIVARLFPEQTEQHFLYIVQITQASIFIPFLLWRMYIAGGTLSWWKEQVKLAPTPKMQISALARTWIFDVGFLCILFGAVALILSKESLTDYLNEPSILFSSSTLAFDIFLAVVIAPILEEILFRGIILHRLLIRWRVSLSIVASSLLFAILHIQEGIVPAFAFGAVLSIVVIKTHSLVSSIYLHMIHNGIISIIAVLSVPTNSAASLQPSDVEGLINAAPIMLMIGIPLLLVGSFLIVRLWRHPYWQSHVMRADV